MDIHIYQLKNALALHAFFRAYRAHPPAGWWFRGHGNINWRLIPKAGRPEYNLGPDRESGRGRDLGRFNAWRLDAVAYVGNLPPNDWECLAVAQHHGLATRLLDWSFNPLVATFFAASEQPDCDGAVYCYDPPAFVDTNSTPLDTPHVGIGFVPRAISPRILNQRAAFTYHSPPDAEIVPTPHVVLKDHANLAKLVIDKDLKRETLQHLDDYGINRVTLFPDLDGLSAHINWETQAMVEWKRDREANRDGV